MSKNNNEDGRVHANHSDVPGAPASDHASNRASAGLPADTLDLRARIWSMIHEVLERARALSDEIDETFAGRLFLDHLPPDAPENIRRVGTCIGYHKKVTSLLFNAVHMEVLLKNPELAIQIYGPGKTGRNRKRRQKRGR